MTESIRCESCVFVRPRSVGSKSMAQLWKLVKITLQSVDFGGYKLGT